MFPHLFEATTAEDINEEENGEKEADEIDGNFSIISQICSEFNLSYLQVLEMSVVEVFYLFNWVVQKLNKEMKQLEQTTNN